MTRNKQNFLSKYPNFYFVKYIKGDIREIKNSVNFEFEFVINAATDGNIANHKSNPKESYDTIVKGTENLINYISNSKKMLGLYMS